MRAQRQIPIACHFWRSRSFRVTRLEVGERERRAVGSGELNNLLDRWNSIQQEDRSMQREEIWVLVRTVKGYIRHSACGVRSGCTVRTYCRLRGVRSLSIRHTVLPPPYNLPCPIQYRTIILCGGYCLLLIRIWLIAQIIYSSILIKEIYTIFQFCFQRKNNKI